jgi:phage terminase small subunit
MTSPSRRPDPALARAAKQRKRAADPEGLCPRERLFVEAYVLSGGNATKAYQACMAPVIVKASSAASLGWRMLRTVKVRAAIDRRRAERFQALKMEADEALSLIALRARANLADAYDDSGKLLPFHQWPESLQLACRWRIDKDGQLEVQHSDGLKATELMAIATGKLKTNVLQPQFDHERYLAGIDDPPAKNPGND